MKARSIVYRRDMVCKGVVQTDVCCLMCVIVKDTPNGIQTCCCKASIIMHHDEVCSWKSASEVAPEEQRRDSSDSDRVHDGEKEETVEEEDEEADSAQIYVPKDPREWTAEHVSTWLLWVSKNFHIFPPIEPARFPDTGQEIARFSKADFWVCAGSKAGGSALARHFAHLLHTGTGIEDRQLLSNTEPGTGTRLTLFTPIPPPPGGLVSEAGNLLTILPLPNGKTTSERKCSPLLTHLDPSNPDK